MENEIVDPNAILAKYGGYGSTNASIPPYVEFSGKGSNNIQYDTFSPNQNMSEEQQLAAYSAGQRGIDYTNYDLQTGTVTNILNSTDPTEFNDIANYALTDPSLDNGHKAVIRQKFAKNYLDQREQDKIQGMINSIPPTELVKMVQQSPTTDLENANVDRSEQDRRSAALKAVAYGTLGLTELSKRYQEIAYPKNTYTAEMLADGSRYTTERSPTGQLINAYNSRGQRISGEEFGKVSAGALDPGKKGVEGSFTVGYDKFGQTYSKSLIGGQLYFRNLQTNELSPTAPVGYREERDPKDEIAARARLHVRERLSKENQLARASNVPQPNSEESIRQQEQAAARAVYDAPTIASGGGLSVENSNFPAVQAVGAPANYGQGPEVIKGGATYSGGSVNTAQPGVDTNGTPQLPVNSGPNSPADLSEKAARQIADYDTPPLKVNSPTNRVIMARVHQLNPGYSAVNYETFKKVAESFSGSNGNAVALRNVKNAWTDLDITSKLAYALDNGNNLLINDVRNEFKDKTGEIAPVDFDTMKIAVAGEIAKVIKGGVATQAEVKSLEDKISSARSPKQLAAVLSVLKELVAGRAVNIRATYTGNGGSIDKFNNSLLADDSLRDAMEVHDIKAELANRARKNRK